jgi:hypothetical protein
MDFRVVFTNAAINDLHGAVAYYNDKLPGLGLRMFGQTERALSRIKAQPLSFSRRFEDIRACKVSDFPYLIFYFPDTDKGTITILRIFNEWQKPFHIEGETIG